MCPVCESETVQYCPINVSRPVLVVIIKLIGGTTVPNTSLRSPPSMFCAMTSASCGNQSRSTPQHPVPPKPLGVLQL